MSTVKPVLSKSDSLETGLTGATFAQGTPNFLNVDIVNIKTPFSIVSMSPPLKMNPAVTL